MENKKNIATHALFTALLPLLSLVVFSELLYQAIFLDYITIYTKGNFYHIIYSKEPKLFLFTSLFSLVSTIFSSYIFFHYLKVAYIHKEEKHIRVFYIVLFIMLTSSIFYLLSKLLSG